MALLQEIMQLTEAKKRWRRRREGWWWGEANTLSYLRPMPHDHAHAHAGHDHHGHASWPRSRGRGGRAAGGLLHQPRLHGGGGGRRLVDRQHRGADRCPARCRRLPGAGHRVVAATGGDEGTRRAVQLRIRALQHAGRLAHERGADRGRMGDAGAERAASCGLRSCRIPRA